MYGRSVDQQLSMEFERHRSAVREDIRTVDDFIAAYHAEVRAADAKWNFRKSGWARHDAARKAALVHQAGHDPTKETLQVYELIYRMTSEALHSGIGGTMRSVLVDGGTATLQHTARALRPTALLILAFGSFMYLKVMDYVNDELALGLEPELKRLDAARCALLGSGTAP